MPKKNRNPTNEPIWYHPTLNPDGLTRDDLSTAVRRRIKFERSLPRRIGRYKQLGITMEYIAILANNLYPIKEDDNGS